MTQNHELSPSPTTVQWGYFDGGVSPVIEIASGDTVTIHSVSGNPFQLPPAGAGTVRPELRAIHEAVKQDPGPHILTGSVAVKGAKPGDTLKVEILDVTLRDDWGFSITREGAGALPTLFSDEVSHFAIDRQSGRIETPWEIALQARPFFGVLGVAPGIEAGRVTSIEPGSFGGNIDNKELVAGTTLYLPVSVDGALFAAGDGHGIQGDGEVCVTAVETGLTGTFRLSVLPGDGRSGPRAETPTHLIAMDFDYDLDLAVQGALRQLIGWLGKETGLAEQAAYRLCSLVADVRVTQVVNRKKGIHIMFPKDVVASLKAAR
jgi:acetamidase/formamidase